MKRILLALALLFSFSAVTQAQKKMIIVNHTDCEWSILPFADIVYTGGGPQAHYSGPAVNLAAPNAFNFYGPGNSWTPMGGGTPTSWQSTWIWSHVELFPVLCSNSVITVSGTDNGQSAWHYANGRSTSYEQLGTCCGDPNTVTWTDLANGDVQIDIY